MVYNKWYCGILKTNYYGTNFHGLFKDNFMRIAIFFKEKAGLTYKHAVPIRNVQGQIGLVVTTVVMEEKVYPGYTVRHTAHKQQNIVSPNSGYPKHQSPTD